MSHNLFDSLESRRLFAATAVVTDGVLHITGTDNADTIKVSVGFRTGGSEAKGYTFNPIYSVRANRTDLGIFDAKDVDQIKIDGLGGRDDITGPTSFVTVNHLGIGSTPVKRYIIGPFDIADCVIDGGSGSDRITGGSGDDTLIGGRGNDFLIDQYGTNTLNGGHGDDTYNVSEGKDHVIKTVAGKPVVRYVPVLHGTPDTIIDATDGPGTVNIFKVNSDDILQGVGVQLGNNHTDQLRTLKLTTLSANSFKSEIL